MNKGQVFGSLLRCGGGLRHQATDGGMGQQQGVELLFDQVRFDLTATKTR